MGDSLLLEGTRSLWSPAPAPEPFLVKIKMESQRGFHEARKGVVAPHHVPLTQHPPPHPWDLSPSPASSSAAAPGGGGLRLPGGTGGGSVQTPEWGPTREDTGKRWAPQEGHLHLALTH